MASRGEAPPIIMPVIAPGSEMRPTVLALSRTGDSAMTRDLFTCCFVACLGVAPRANAVSTCKGKSAIRKKSLTINVADSTDPKEPTLEIGTSYIDTYQVQLNLDIISKPFHCNPSYCHCISNHHSCDWDDVSWGKREDV